MYRFDAALDFSPPIGAEVIQVCIDQLSVIYHLHPGGKIANRGGGWRLLNERGDVVDSSTVFEARELSSLRALAIAGGMWTRMQVDSFKPLEKLRNLELLHLANIKAEDESLKPLAGLKNLKHLDIANFYPMTEFAWLSKQLTTTECTWFQPYIAMKHMECTKCKKPTMVMLTGKRKPTLCSGCDEKALERHLRDWNVFLEQAA